MVKHFKPNAILKEVDNSPTGIPTEIIFPNDSLSYLGRVATVDFITPLEGTYLKLDCSNDPLTQPLDIAPNEDITNSFGRWKMGYDGLNADLACLSHYDKMSWDTWALAQDSDGKTYLSGASLSFRLSTGTVYAGLYNSGGIDPRFYIMGAALTLGGTAGSERVFLRQDGTDPTLLTMSTPYSNLGFVIEGDITAIDGAFSGSLTAKSITIDDYITAVGANRWGKLSVDDSDDYIHLSKEDANILGFKLDMDLLLDSDSYGIKLGADQDFIISYAISGNATINCLTGYLFLNPSAAGDVKLFSSTDVLNASDGKKLIISRRALEGDTDLSIYISSIGITNIISSGYNGAMTISANDGISELGIYASNLRLNQYGSGKGNLYHYGNVLGETSKKYIYWYLSETNGYYWLDRQDTTILGLYVDMPMLITGNILLNQTDGNEYITGNITDGYTDLGGTLGIRLNSPSTRVTGDLYVGNGSPSAIVFDDVASDGQISYEDVAGNFVISNSIEVTDKSKLTPIGGFAIKLTNKTGGNTVAGQIVKADTANNDAVILTAADDTECFGVFLDSGIADGSEAWVVVSGIADVAMKDNTAATRGNWVETSTEAGYADATNASPAAAPVHFQEIGHCIESVSATGAGTHILARCVLHFN